MGRSQASAIYTGWVRHRRYHPREHSFRYRLYLMYLDLSELDEVFRGRRFWSLNRPNLGEFRRSDYLGDPNVALDEAVRRRATEVLGRRPEGPIRLLAHLRTFGHCFNPVSFYYCFQGDGETLDCVVAEITNTPWKERHSYVLAVDSATVHGSALQWDFDKEFHVSPFLPMRRSYCWRLQLPGEDLRVHMDVVDQGVVEFDATLVLQRRALSASTLARCLLRYPLMSLRVVVAIHWQAFLLWCRRVPVHDHPSKSLSDSGPGSLK
jgi:DUF1365 family protein